MTYDVIAIVASYVAVFASGVAVGVVIEALRRGRL